MKYIDLLIVLHAIIWLYVIFGSFIDNNHAKFIVYMIIPFIYLLHMLPVHFLNKLKKDELKIESTIDLNKKLNEMYTESIDSLADDDGQQGEVGYVATPVTKQEPIGESFTSKSYDKRTYENIKDHGTDMSYENE